MDFLFIRRINLQAGAPLKNNIHFQGLQ